MKISAKSLVLAPAVAAAVSGVITVPAVATTTAPPAPAPAECLPSGTPGGEAPGTESPAAVPALADGPEATVDAAQVSQTDIADPDKGIGFSGTGFTADSSATVTVTGTEGTEYTAPTELTVSSDGEVKGVYFFTVTNDGKVPLGTYTLHLTDTTPKKDSSEVTFEVVEKVDAAPVPTAPAPAPTECATPTAEETPSAEPTETGTPTPSDTPSTTAPTTPAPEDTGTPTPSPETTAPTTPTPEGTGTPTPSPETTEPTTPTPEDTGTPTPEGSATPTPTESAIPGDTDEPAVAAFGISIDPTEISSADFADEDKGVTITVTGAQPGEQITVQVEHAQGQVERFQIDKIADENGNAVVGVHAEGDPVLGEYRVSAFGPESEPMAGAFTVVTNSSSVGDEAGNQAGGSGSGQGSDDGSSLPRTGSEMTGLALGAGLLVVGAAAVVVTRRRTRSTDPADI